MPRNLTDKFCYHARPPAAGRKEVSDALTPGLQFRVTDKGVKSWSLLYRLNGELRRDTIGRFPEIGVGMARKRAAHALELAGAGNDPRAEKAAVDAAQAVAAGNTVRAAVEAFKTTYAGQRRWRDLGRILDNEAVTPWGDRQVASITRKDILARLDTIAERAPVRANRALSVFRLFFKWCRSRELIEASPAADIDPPTVEKSRERTLTDREIAAFWHATGAQGWPFGPLFRLLLLTGARRDEIGALEWPEVDDTARTLEISGERIKGGRPLVIPLSAPALVTLKEVPRIADSEFVFTTTGEAPVSGYSKAKTILDAFMLAELRKADAGARLQPFRLHDLRRTCRSGMSRLQIPADIAELAIGHALSGIRKVYDRYDYLQERRDALDKWAGHVLQLATPPEAAKVVRLKRRR